MNDIDREWLIDMLEYAREARSLLGAGGADELDADRKTLLAVRLAIQTVGEAATRVSPQAQAEFPQIPWNRIIGMRHRLVHGYRTIATTLIVDTVRDHIPPLIAILEAAGVEKGA
jgi:uncharacterized protein with HEPN domain